MLPEGTKTQRTVTDDEDELNFERYRDIVDTERLNRWIYKKALCILGPQSIAVRLVEEGWNDFTGRTMEPTYGI